MEKFITRKKMNKNARRKLDRARRNTWGMISPITQKIESKKVYNRKKVRQEGNDSLFVEPSIFALS
jgi:hypothetical protein